jgi:hypothetical protein
MIFNHPVCPEKDHQLREPKFPIGLPITKDITTDGPV